MERRYARTTNIGVGLGILLKLVGAVLVGSSETQALGSLILAAGFGMFIWGCAAYAEGKGYPGHYGLLGLFSIWGIVALAAMKERKPGEVVPAARQAPSPKFMVFALIVVAILGYLAATGAFS